MKIHKFLFLNIALVLGTSIITAQSIKDFEISKEWLSKIEGIAPASPTVKNVSKKKILVFSKATGFYHWTIPHNIEMLKILAKKSSAFEIHVGYDIENFDKKNLKKYDAVILNNSNPNGPKRDLFYMERRKISKLGKYSLVVTLPKDCTKMNKLQGGDEVSLKIQGDGSLVIHPEFDFKEKQNEFVLPINVNEDVKMIQRRIIGCYLNGYDTIVLKSGKNFSREQQDGIRSIVKSLYMRIYESHANQVTLQAFMDESLASVTSGIERMHIITSSMAKDLIISLKS